MREVPAGDEFRRPAASKQEAVLAVEVFCAV